MLKAYNYFLFRVYMFYKRYEKGNFTFSTSVVSTVLITINLMTLYLLLNYLDFLPDIPNKLFVVFFLMLIWIVNYFGIVRKEAFLRQNFRTDKTGGYLVVGVIIFTATFAIVVGAMNREKVLTQKQSVLNISNLSTKKI